MADTSNSNPNNVQLLQLEAKRKSDSSWLPCHLSIRPTGGLAVKFEGQDLEDIILNVEDALSSLRVRSAPLQGDDCCHIEGKHVLAAYEKNTEKLFFDAVVKKVLKVRHSQRAFCRCSFMVKWLFHNVDEVLTIPSGSIMKLAAESIKSHPVVAEFLDSVESTFLSRTGLDEIDHEINVNGFLGMQIQEMGTLIDVTKNGLVEDTLLGVDHGVSFGGRGAQTKSPTSEHACKLQAEVNCRHEQFRSPTRNQEEMKTKDEDLMLNPPSCSKVSSENRSRLNPLAARAVLASLVSRTPQKIGFLHHREEKPISLDLINGTMKSPVHKTHHLHNIDDPEPTNLVDNVKSLRKTEERSQKADGNMLCAKTSCRVLVLERDHRNNTSKDYHIPSPLSLSRDEESTQPVRTGRVTRSAIKQDNRTSNGEVKSTLLAEDVTFDRVTRSGAHKRNANMTDDVQEPLSSKPRRVSRTDSTAKEIESRISKRDDNSQTCSDKTNPTTITSTTRVTRSAARKLTGTFDSRVKQSMHDRSGIESTKSDYAQKNDCISDFEASEKKRASTLVDVKLKSAERNKKQKVSNDGDRRQNTTVEILHTDLENLSPKKRISSQDQLSQSSPQIICGLLAVSR